MSGWHLKTVKTRDSRARKNPCREVSNQQLIADAERGVAYFYAQRPWLCKPVPDYAHSSRNSKGTMTIAEAVRVAIKIGELQRGALKCIAEANGLDYAKFTKAYYKAKRTGVLPEVGAAPVKEDVLGRVAAEIVAGPDLPRGAIKAKAQENGLNYDSLMTRVVRLRAQQAAQPGRAVA